ncbi:MAG: hypothetical protein ACLGJC_17260 [Alphaproteobacteria bacterium]
MPKPPKQAKAKADPMHISPRTRALLGAPDAAQQLSDALVTHHHKLPQTSVPDSQAIKDLGSIGRSLDNGVGVCSATIASEDAFSATYGGADIAIGQDLCVNPNETTPSLLRLARGGSDDDLLARGLTEDMIPPLRTAVGSNMNRYPNAVARQQSQVYFEAGDDCVLVTPVYPVKFAHELNHRLQQRRTAYQALRNEHHTQRGPEGTAARRPGTGFGSVPRLPPAGSFSVGGANPQNVGAIINKNSATTRRSGVPVLLVRQPRDLSRPIDKVLRKLRAAGRYASVAELPEDALLTYGWRAARGIALATHRNAEASQASELARFFLEMRMRITPVLLSFDPSFWSDGGWNRVAPIERAFLDPRQGELDIAALTRVFARSVAARIETSINRASATRHADTDENQPRFLMPDRSVKALEDAFCLALTMENA